MRTCALYDSTVKAIGSDQIHVRYRQQQRALIHDIILNKSAGKPLKEYISAQILQLIKEDDRKSFFEDGQHRIRIIKHVKDFSASVMARTIPFPSTYPISIHDHLSN